MVAYAFLWWKQASEFIPQHDLHFPPFTTTEFFNTYNPQNYQCGYPIDDVMKVSRAARDRNNLPEYKATEFRLHMNHYLVEVPPELNSYFPDFLRGNWLEENKVRTCLHSDKKEELGLMKEHRSSFPLTSFRKSRR